MLDQILNLVKQYGQQSVVDNPDVPNEYNNQVMAEAASTITNGFQNMASGGGLQSILSLFTGGQNQSNGGGILSNSIVSMMIGHLANRLVSNMNLSPATANSIANNIIPSVINSMVSKTASSDPGDSGFNLNSLIGSLTGGGNSAAAGGFDFQGLLSQVTGGQDTGGGVNIGDIISQVTQSAQQHQQSQQSGGLANLISGFFK
ncbi:hypothetical protein [Niabella drilacis]|uniref:DUF937 domain-containing protein n=1 Tax=Niabella drilacis (strain DSM 25811 / CCM 8410 / CCUG 62505 / LMG 26954 / E90) TaxID=1285928 RepID=A0A1G6Q407_NIADE|nr:hypothetical protein [Niabella drilacis]SDC86674.1 hypothetical protein SAMN04487894_104257 [Niabella drilacis]